MTLELNQYGNVDVRQGVPSGYELWDRLPYCGEILARADIEHAKALTCFTRAGRPKFSWIVERGASAKVTAELLAGMLAELDVTPGTPFSDRCEAALRTMDAAALLEAVQQQLRWDEMDAARDKHERIVRAQNQHLRDKGVF